MIAGLPAPVLPFTTLKEVQVLLVLLPGHIRTYGTDMLSKKVKYANLTKAYNAQVTQCLEDKDFLFKSTNYVRECVERIMRVSLVQQAIENGSLILSASQQKDLRKRFRAPTVKAPTADAIPCAVSLSAQSSALRSESVIPTCMDFSGQLAQRSVLNALSTTNTPYGLTDGRSSSAILPRLGVLESTVSVHAKSAPEKLCSI